jgi:hypothetical protein
MAYKTFTNGSPLPASDLNTFLMNQSVITFASSTERDSVLTAPTEGMLVYLRDDNKLYLYTGATWEVQAPITTEGDLIVGNSSGIAARFGIGADGQVLTSNGTTVAWELPSSGSVEFSSIASGSLATGAATSTVSGFGGYDNYVIVLRDVTLSAATIATISFNGDATGNYAITDFRQARTIDRSTIPIFDFDDVVETAFVAISIRGAISTSPAMFSYNGGSEISGSGHDSFVGHGIINKDDLQLDSFTIETSTTVTGGTYTIYGA